jgi:large subunit ribosomal protein L6
MKKQSNYQLEIKIPFNVKVEKKEDIIIFSGPLGCSKINIKKLDYKGCIAIHINQEKKVITVLSSLESVYGSVINLIKNKIYGISQGYLLYLRLVGIGYRCFLKNNTLTFKVGFSHDIKYKIPDSIRIFLIEPTLLCLFGIDKNQVTQIAAQIRFIKPPSPYKGKGVRFLQETVRVKQGKQK